MKRQLPPNKTQKKIITCLKLCSFIDRAEIFTLFYDEYFLGKLSFNVVFHVSIFVKFNIENKGMKHE